jgi:enoyl-CoA hydratase/carnithine racemase
MPVHTESTNSARKGRQLMDAVLLVEKKPPLAWLTLNRPEVHNCLNIELLQSIMAACHDLKDRQDVRVVIITGSGLKTFCAGADLAERKGMSESQVLEYLNLIQKTMLAVEALPQPVIAAINGSAFGGGTELLLACDLRIMVAEASLRLTEVRLGIIPGAGGTQRLSRLVGKSLAKELILTAAPVSASRAQQIGLVHKVVQAPAGSGGNHQGLRDETLSWASEIATAAPLSLRQAKYAIDAGYDKELAEGLEIETQAYLKLLHSKDRLEGLAAFAEKRPPVYKGE